MIHDYPMKYKNTIEDYGCITTLQNYYIYRTIPTIIQDCGSTPQFYYVRTTPIEYKNTRLSYKTMIVRLPQNNMYNMSNNYKNTLLSYRNIGQS